MEIELKTDALNIGSKGQHDLRKTIIRMLKDGKKGKKIAKDLGVVTAQRPPESKA